MFKLSIIIPVFNVEEFLERVFDSIVNQTIGFSNLEIIFVDDSSTDNSPSIIDEFSKKYDNVISIHLDKNSGSAGKPRNVGMTYATTDYLMFIDPDDVFMYDACELLYEEIINEGIDIVSGTHTSDGINTHPGLWINTLTDPNEDYEKRRNKVRTLLDGGNFTLKINSIEECPSCIANFAIMSKIFKKSFLIENSIKFAENIVGEDSVFLLNAFINANGIKFIDKFIFRYYHDRTEGENTSMSYTFSKEKMKGRIDAYLEMYHISDRGNKAEIFKHYLLYDKLNYLIREHLLLSDLSTTELLDVLSYASPLFKLYVNYNKNINSDLASLFYYIASNEYESAIEFIYKYKYGRIPPYQNDIKVAVILDSFSRNSFKYEFNSIDLYPDDWLNQFQNEKPDLFFCESAYHGIPTDNAPNGVWNSKVHTNLNDDVENRVELKEILKYCNENSIPTIFWNKEDPASFNDPKQNFVDIALHFDYIFTSAEECIPCYNKKGHNNVFSLMFANQPSLFNPIETSVRLPNTVVFAGTWYKKFSERCRVMDLIFDKIVDYGFDLKIYDRYSHWATEELSFPKKYSPYLNERVDYSEMPNVYKESEIQLNFNTVTESNTMFARRVFELMASNTLIFSNFSKGVYKLFGNNVFYLDKEDINLEDRNLEKIKEENLYNVLENHDYSNRFKQILDSINFKYVPKLKHVVLLYKLNSLTDLNKIYNHFNSISYQYKHIKLITDEKNQFLPDSILESELNTLNFEDNYYFSFVDLSLTPNFIKKALTHYKYIDNSVGIKEMGDKKYSFIKTNQIRNVIFNFSKFRDVVSKENNYFDVYCIEDAQIKVSVIIPAYNVEEYIAECIESAINQTFKEIEIICVNDGSSDSTLDILQEYEKKDSRITVISQPNKGVAGARNTALDIAKGEYICFLDSDDYLELNAIKEIYEISKEKDLDLLMFKIVNQDGETDEKYTTEYFDMPYLKTLVGDNVFNYKDMGHFMYNVAVTMQSNFFRHDLIRDLRFTEGIVFEDEPYLMEALFLSKRVYFYDKYLCNKRNRKGSIVNSTGKDRSDVIISMNKIFDLAKKYNHYENFKNTLYSRKFYGIVVRFKQTDDIYKESFFNKIKEDFLDKKEEYEADEVFQNCDEKLKGIFYAGLYSESCADFENYLNNIN